MYQEVTFWSPQKKNLNLKKCLLFREVQLSSPKLKKILILQKGTLKSHAKKISYFLRLPKIKFINPLL